MLLEPTGPAGAFCRPVTQRYYHVREPAHRLVLDLRVSYAANRLGLVAPPACNVVLHPLGPLLLACLQRPCLSPDPVVPPRARCRPVVERPPLRTAVQATASYGLEVPLVLA